MQHSRFSRPILVLAAVWAAAAFGLRSLILKRSLDVNGILMAGSHALLWTVLFSLVGFAVLAALCFRLNRLPGTNACFSENSLGVIPALIAATLLFFGCLFRLLDEGEVSEPAQKLCEILGIMAAAASALTALTRSRLGRTAFWTQLPLALYCGVSLVLRFRVWSHDPMIIDIAPQLLALVCMMLTSVLLGHAGLPARDQAEPRRHADLPCPFDLVRKSRLPAAARPRPGRDRPGRDARG